MHKLVQTLLIGGKNVIFELPKNLVQINLNNHQPKVLTYFPKHSSASLDLYYFSSPIDIQMQTFKHHDNWFLIEILRPD